MKHDYPSALFWILRNRGGGGGHPPLNVQKVIGWKVTQFVAHLFDSTARQVARDLVDLHEHMEGNQSLENSEGANNEQP